MCNECIQYCVGCGYEFKPGDSAYYALGRDDNLYCLECIEEMDAEEIILNFLEADEIW